MESATTCGQAPPSQKGRRLAQDLVGPLELKVLSLQALDFLALLAGKPRPLSQITLVLPNSQPEGLCLAADSRGNTDDRSPLRIVLLALLSDHPNRSFPDFRAVFFPWLMTPSSQILEPLVKSVQLNF